MTDANNLVKQAIVAYKANDKGKARDLLLKAVDLDERNEQAWMWMSAVVDSVEEQQICLENVLSINPNNDRAKKGLAVLKQKSGNKPPAPPPAAASSSFAGLDLGNNPFSSDNAAASAPPASNDPWGNVGSTATPKSSPPPPPPASNDSWGGIAMPSADDPWGAIPATPAASQPPQTPPPSASPFITNGSDDPWGAIGDAFPAAPATPDTFGTPPPAPADDPWGSVPTPTTSSGAWGVEETPSDPFAGDANPFGSTSSTANEAWSASESNFDAPPVSSPARSTSTVSAYSSSGYAFGDAYEFVFEDDDADIDDLFGDNLDFESASEFEQVASPYAEYYKHIPAEIREVAQGKGGSTVSQIALVGALFILNIFAVLGLLIA